MTQPLICYFFVLFIVLQLDFDQNLMMLTDELPLDLYTYQQLPLIFEKGNMFVTIHCSIGGKRLENRFLIHSGYNGAQRTFIYIKPSHLIATAFTVI